MTDISMQRNLYFKKNKSFGYNIEEPSMTAIEEGRSSAIGNHKRHFDTGFTIDIYKALCAMLQPTAERALNNFEVAAIQHLPFSPSGQTSMTAHP